MTAPPQPDIATMEETPHDVLQATEPSTDPPKKKRQKIALACDTCRIRKVRCDGIRPGE
jgi:hypothetical protein